MNKAIRYRVYPTEQQQNFFLQTVGCCRKVWNLMLADKIAYYNDTKQTLHNTPAQYKTDYPFLKEVDSLALANTQMHLQSAYQSFFDKKRKKQNGFPRFKSKKHSRKSYTTNNQNGTVALVFEGKKGYIKLPKAGLIEARIHRKPEEGWKVKSATISQESDGAFYISVLFEFEKVILRVPFSDNAIGLDYKSDGLYMDSNGKIGTNHKYYRESHKKLAKAQRKLSRKTGFREEEKKSKNYYKQLQRVNKIHRHIANQRLDNLHKKSTEIANRYNIVCVEDLDMKAISNKCFGNGKSTMDNGYGMFLRMLEYKLKERGKYLVKIDKWYPSSQVCSCCGARQKLKLKDRVYACECGFVLDRDWNAAINIRREGMRICKTAA